MEPDRRGAAVLALVGAVGVAGSAGFLLTAANVDSFPIAVAALGLSLGLAIAGLLRRLWGRVLPSPITRREEHLAAPPSVARGAARLFAFAFDAGALLGLTLVAYELFRMMPYDEHQYDYALANVKGLAYLRILKPHLMTHVGADELSGGIAALLVGLYLVVPAATWGATPGMLLIGRVWARTDGQRVGALHGAGRALGGLIVLPLQGALVALSIVSGGGRYRVVSTGQRFRAPWNLVLVARARRNLPDIFFRTEYTKRSRAEDGRG